MVAYMGGSNRIAAVALYNYPVTTIRDRISFSDYLTNLTVFYGMDKLCICIYLIFLTVS